MVNKGLLVHLGCDVTAVSSADECLRVVSQEHKVVFVDVSIPGNGAEDSYRVAARMHERFAKRHGRPLVVAITGNTDRVSTENCLKVGMDGVVLKPVSVDKMRRVLLELSEHGVYCEAH